MRRDNFGKKVELTDRPDQPSGAIISPSQAMHIATVFSVIQIQTHIQTHIQTQIQIQIQVQIQKRVDQRFGTIILTLSLTIYHFYTDTDIISHCLQITGIAFDGI